MRNDNNKGVNMNQPEMIVQVVRSGNRLNAFDSNGVKMTSDITLRMWEAVPTNATQTWVEIP